MSKSFGVIAASNGLCPKFKAKASETSSFWTLTETLIGTPFSILLQRKIWLSAENVHQHNKTQTNAF